MKVLLWRNANREARPVAAKPGESQDGLRSAVGVRRLVPSATPMRVVGYASVAPGSGTDFDAAAAAIAVWCEPRGLTLTTVIHDVEPRNGRTGDRPGFAYGLSQIAAVAALASAHHERLDGSGYPHGWAAPELTMPMRALAVADVYEALTSARPYRPARTSELALEIIRSDAPHGLDADAVLALETLLKNPDAKTVTRLPTPIRPKTSAKPR